MADRINDTQYHSKDAYASNIISSGQLLAFNPYIKEEKKTAEAEARE